MDIVIYTSDPDSMTDELTDAIRKAAEDLGYYVWAVHIEDRGQ